MSGGHIYKRGNVWCRKYHKGGEPYYESSRSTKEADAKRLLRRRLGEIAEGRFFGLRPERVRFEDLAEDFLNDYRVNGKRSLDKAQRSVRHLQGCFGSMCAVDITTDKIRAYIAERQAEGVSNGEINRELAALKRMFNLALQQSPPKVSSRPYIPMLKEGSPRAGFFEHADFLVLRAALPAEIRPVVTFAYHTGWRKHEVLGMTWDRVDLQARTARLDAGTTKNNEGRLIYLEGELYGMLAELRRRDPFGRCVFPRQGVPIKDFRAAWDRACIEVGLKRARCSMIFAVRRSGTWSGPAYPDESRSRSVGTRRAPSSTVITSSAMATCARPPSARRSTLRARYGLQALVAVGTQRYGDNYGYYRRFSPDFEAPGDRSQAL